MSDWTIGVVSPANYPHSQAFHDVARALAGALKDLGSRCVLATIDSTNSETVIYPSRQLVLGANLLPDHPELTIEPDAVLFNLEQWNTGWFTQGYLQLLRQHEVWDYSERNIECLQAAGVQAKLCRIGHHPCLERIKPVEQDIDVLFYGSNTTRRMAIMHEMALAEAGINFQAFFGVYGPERDALIARSRVVLNLHAYDQSPLEIVRLQLLFANRVCVLTETCSADDPEWNLYRGCMAEGTTAKHLASTAKMLLADDSIRAQLGELGHSAFKARPQAEYLKGLL